MALRHVFLRFTPRLDARWVVGAVVVALLVAVATYVRWQGPPPPLDLVALGPEGEFEDTLRIPAEWGDTATTTPDAVIRVPLILGVRNLGRSAVTPERLSLSVPLRYRLTDRGGGELDARLEAGSPLITYTLQPGLPPVEPERLPEMLPAHDTLWLEVVVPSFYCVAVGDSIPEFVPAPPPPVGPMSDLRIFYSFEGGDLGERRTGTLTVRIDSSLLAVDLPDEPPTFPMRTDPELARPDLGTLRRVGSRRARCGEGESGMELLSTVWETAEGGRFITLDYGGTVRKHLYDLDGDGVIERESWAPTGEEFTATRRAELPIPEFLLPAIPSGDYPLARFDSLSADSLRRLDPFRRAMPGPGPVPGDSAARTDSPASGAVRRPPPDDAAPSDVVPEPRVEPVQPTDRPLGDPAPPDTIPGERTRR